MDERPVSQVHGKPEHETIAEGHCEMTYGARCTHVSQVQGTGIHGKE